MSGAGQLTAGAALMVLQIREAEDGRQLAVEPHFPSLVCLLRVALIVFRLLPRLFLVCPDHASLPQHQLLQFLILRLVRWRGQRRPVERGEVPTVSWQQHVHHPAK